MRPVVALLAGVRQARDPRPRRRLAHGAAARASTTPLEHRGHPRRRTAWRAARGQKPSDDPRAGLCYHALHLRLALRRARSPDRRALGRALLRRGDRRAARARGLDRPPPRSTSTASPTLELAPDWPRERRTCRRRPSRATRSPLDLGQSARFRTRELPVERAAASIRAEIPAVGGIGTARSIATPLRERWTRSFRRKTLELARTTPLRGLRRSARGAERPVRGRLPAPDRNTRFGPAPDAFGHDGAGGSVHGAWPGQRVGFSYAMNLMRDDAATRDRRRSLAALLAALYSE